MNAIKTPNKYQLADQMRNSMHIADEFLPLLSIYRMNHCTGEQFKRAVSDGQISMVNNGTFNVIYHQCTPVAAKRAVEVRLSFRAALDKSIEPIVLVQIVQAEQVKLPESGSCKDMNEYHRKLIDLNTDKKD